MKCKPMRLVVAGALPPTVGGIATVVAQHVSWMRRQGLEVEVVNTGRRRRRRPGAASFENAAAVVVDAARVARACRASRPDLVVVHTVGSPELPVLRALALAAAARASRVPVVTHLHGYDIEAHACDGRSTYRRLLALLVRSSARVVTLHEDTRDAVLFASPDANAVVVPNCVDSTPRDPVANAEKRVVFVGTVGERKGVAQLLAAIAALPTDVQCHLVGGHGEEDPAVYQTLIALAETLGISERVRFHGELDHDAALRVMETASVFALPSTAEGMPMSLLESLALGVPAVVTNAGAMGTLIRDSGAGVVVPAGDVDCLAGALRDLLSDKRRLLACAAAGKNLIEERHRCERVLPRLLEEYEVVRRG